MSATSLKICLHRSHRVAARGAAPVRLAAVAIRHAALHRSLHKKIPKPRSEEETFAYDGGGASAVLRGV